MCYFRLRRMFNHIESRIPEGDPHLKIGPLQIWVSGYTSDKQEGMGDLSYCRTPTLLTTENVVIFSQSSDTPIFSFRSFLEQLVAMSDHIGVVKVAELVSWDSEFTLTLTSNELGQIEVIILYKAWQNNGNFEIEAKIDQSYLPPLIKGLEQILNTHS